MKTNSIKPAADAADGDIFLGENWFDPLEAGVRTRIRGFIEELLEAELENALSRKRYERGCVLNPETGSNAKQRVPGYRHGHRNRTLLGTFGTMDVSVPRARLETPEGKTVEWKNAAIPA